MLNMSSNLQRSGLRKMSTCVLTAAVFLTTVTGGGQLSVAEEMTIALPTVMPTDVIYNGSFSQQIDFKLPEQRGLEPRLGLVYDSGRVNAYGPDSLVGAGWQLRGLSEIQRTNFRRAVPRFNSEDIWLLDGEELVPCGSYAEAGCGAGGTHATRVENYQRIRQVSEGNTWEVTVRDGTKYTYKSLSTWAPAESIPLTGNAATDMLENYRYLLAEKENTLGQKVVFDYVCGDSLDCRISTIAYDIGEVTFHWETRPDPISYAAGRMLAKNTNRLRTVEIHAAGGMLRTYELSYVVSAASSRSLLSAVTERGRDSVVDAAGAVTSGTALPPYEFQYSGDVPSPVQIADVVAEKALFTKPSQWSGPYGYGQFGEDNKVYRIFKDGNKYYTSETPRRSITGIGYTGSDNNLRFYYIKNGSTRKRKIIHYYEYRVYPNSSPQQFFDSTYGRPRLIADFDGDGRDDVTGSDGSPVKQRYSASWSAGSWGGYGNGGNSAADLNGDGLVDIYDPEANHIEFHLSNGRNNFAHVYNHSLSPYYGSFKVLGDYNGDGTADFLIANNSGNSYKIYYTVGEAMVAGPTFQLADSCSPNCARPRSVGDWNGDGLVDLGVDLSGGKTLIYLNKGGEFVPLKLGDDNFELGDKYIPVGDVDEDGLDELVKSSEYSIAGFGAERWVLFPEIPDLLNFVRSPLGSETSVTYEKHKPETQTDLPLNLVVVTSLEIFDGRSIRARTDYAYAGARWAWRERRFLGFEKITATLPQNAGESGRPTIETTYMQDLASVGKVKQIVRKDGAGNVLQQVVEVYDIQVDTKPFWSRNTETITTTYLDGVAKETREERQFNTYGLVDKTIRHGDTSKSGGEQVHTRWLYPNLEKYIVDRWAVETINSGTEYDYSANREWRRWHYYDGANDNVTQPPTFGLKTQTSEWTGGEAEDKVPLAVNTYDAFGNVVSQADGLGNTTGYIYDTAYHLFPEEIRNPRYAVNNQQKKLFTWDKVCGVVLTETDENGAVTSHSYDPLCRKVRTSLPGGGRIDIDHVDWGSPTASHNRTSTLHPNGAGEIVQEAYFDGLGRTYLEKTSTAKQTASADPGQVDETALKTPYVANLIPDQLLAEDAPWLYTVPADTFTDSDGDILQYSARQSNGAGLPQWLSFDSASRTFSGTPPVGAIGTMSLSVIASDGTGAGEDIFKLSVLTPNPPIVENAIADQTAETGTAWSFAVPVDTFSDADEGPLSYSATLANGVPLPSWLRFDEASLTFTSTPPNRAVSLKVTASDGAASVAETFDLSTTVKETRVQKGWGIKAYLTRGILTIVSDTQSQTHDRRRNQNPYYITVTGGNARITRFDYNDGKICTFQYIDLREERVRTTSPNGSVTYSDWAPVKQDFRGNYNCG